MLCSPVWVSIFFLICLHLHMIKVKSYLTKHFNRNNNNNNNNNNYRVIIKSTFSSSPIISNNKHQNIINYSTSSHSTLSQSEEDIPRSLVICGPSGVGKGTIISSLISKFPLALSLCVSHTSRLPRPNEIDGIHYHFVSKDFMENKISSNKFFLESAKVHDNLYGTSFECMNEVLESGKVCILDVDVKGVKQMKQTGLQGAKYLFIAPPSMETLLTRLANRGTESVEQVSKRISNAKLELEFGLAPGNFHAVIVNDDLKDAIESVNNIILNWFPSLQV